MLVVLRSHLPILRLLTSGRDALSTEWDVEESLTTTSSERATTGTV